jgi:prepilin peptidase CpaA
MRPYLNASGWQLAYGLALIIFISTACAEDIKRKRVSNALLLAMLCAGVFINTLHAPTGPQGLAAYHLGPLGAPLALLGSLVGFALLFPLYLARGLGAGDVKLMAALGSFFGPAEIINLTLVVLVTGGCFAAIRVIWIDKTRIALNHIAELVTSVTSGNPQRFDPSTQSAERMPFVPAIAMGVLIYAGWRWTGGAPFIRF